MYEKEVQELKKIKNKVRSEFLNDVEFKLSYGERFVCLLAIYHEPFKDPHIMTVYYSKDGFKGFAQEIEFFLYTIRNSSVRTSWTVLKEGDAFIDLTQYGLPHNHLNRAQ